MKTLKVISNCLIGFVSILSLFILLITFFNKDNQMPKIGNYSLLEVRGTSMYPSIKNGDLIAIDRRIKSVYKVGDVVTFVKENGNVITHEIVGVDTINGESIYYTKGINNNYQDNDYIKINQIIGEYKGFRIPLLGYIAGFANSKIGYFMLVILTLGLILGLTVYELIKETKKKRGEI